MSAGCVGSSGMTSRHVVVATKNNGPYAPKFSTLSCRVWSAWQSGYEPYATITLLQAHKTHQEGAKVLDGQLFACPACPCEKRFCELQGQQAPCQQRSCSGELTCRVACSQQVAST